MRVPVHLPTLLRRAAGGSGKVWARGKTLRQALDDLTRRHPALQVHLYDETGGFRRHVLCYLNETDSRWLKSLDVPLQAADAITIIQAVSGG